MRFPFPKRCVLGLAGAGLALGVAASGGCEATPAAAAAAPTRGLFLTSDQCARCHSRSPSANALTTATGDDASPYGLWQATPMANAFRDPYWRAQLAHEIESAPSTRVDVEALCLRCHAPMATHAALLEDRPLPALAGLQSDPLARDGVSCALCHQIQADGLGSEQSFGGHVVIRDEKRIFGPFADPAPGPMRMNTGYTPTAAAHVSTSALCGACHTLSTSSAPGAHPFLEQSPYLEWRNSVFCDEAGASAETRTCQACHMPDQGSMKIARMPTGDDFNIAVRDGVRGHALVGGNAWLIDLLRANRAELGVTASETALVRTAAATRAQLAFRTARLAIENVVRGPGGVSFELAVQNLAGHKLPSGYPARRAWLQVEVRSGAVVLFQSGALDERGHLAGVGDELAMPHVQRVERATDVPVYEMVACDAAGAATTALLRMASRRKDTRLLPRGWRADGPHAQETAPVGVDGDPDFVAGGDRVSYVLDLGAPRSGTLTIVAWLRYQPMPPAWVDALRASKTPEARDFLRMYDRASFEPETLALAIRIVD